jgi:hypothetical protein
MDNIVILSLPRSGSSMLAGLVASAGYRLQLRPDSEFTSPSEFNRNGYNEEVAITLLNDQIIRMKWGMGASNLYIPPVALDAGHQLPTDGGGFCFDLDESSVYLPDQFLERVEQYTGVSWDVWGLSRMRPGQKWYKAYSRHHMATGADVLERIREYALLLNQEASGVVVKDPRLGLTLEQYSLDASKHRIIRVLREPDAVMKSMRRHFGDRLFTKNFLPGDKCIVSNHFNYQIGFQTFDEYWRRYNALISNNTLNFNTLELRYEKIIDGSQLALLEDYLGGRVARDFIKRAENHF